MASLTKLSRVGLEVYTTTNPDEDLEEDLEEDSEEVEDSEELPEETSLDNDDGSFPLQIGDITQIDYIGEVYSDSFEYDYSGITSSASVSLPINYLRYFFKGKRVALKKAWQTSDKLEWEDTEIACIGFINEISYNKDKVEIKIKGLDALLEKEEQFDFKQTLRSEIVTQIIEASGLKAVVNVEGLDDDITDFTTVSETKEDTSTGTTSSTGSASIDEAVKSAIKGKKSAYDKAVAIDEAFKSHVYYSYYWDVEHPDLEEAWNHAHLNCADGANVLCAMFTSAGINAVIVHTGAGGGHYIVRVNVDGQTYYTDNAAADGSHTSREFGEVYKGITDGSDIGTRIEA